jgi:hypothetical protein
MMSAPAYVREIPQHHRLEAGRCKHCGKIYFPQRLVCHDCRAREFETVQLSRQGKVITFTVIHIAPSQFADQAPYALGIIEVDPGVRLMTQIVDCDLNKIEIGMPVKLEFREVIQDGEAGIIAYGYKAVPAN